MRTREVLKSLLVESRIDETWVQRSSLRVRKRGKFEQRSGRYPHDVVDQPSSSYSLYSICLERWVMEEEREGEEREITFNFKSPFCTALTHQLSLSSSRERRGRVYCTCTPPSYGRFNRKIARFETTDG